jgi:hypothetical protein
MSNSILRSQFFNSFFIERKDPISLHIELGPENFTGPLVVVLICRDFLDFFLNLLRKRDLKSEGWGS